MHYLWKKIIILKNKIQKQKQKQNKKTENFVQFHSGDQITDILFRIISILAEIWKNTFPKEIFNETWLKIREHEKIYINEILLKENYSFLKWRQKQFFDIAQ